MVVKSVESAIQSLEISQSYVINSGGNMVETFEAPASKLNLERLGLPNDLEARRPVGVDLFFSGLEQAKQRRELSQNLRHVFEQVKDVSLNFDQALDLGLIQPDDLASIYRQLTEFVAADENNSRILLYLPFQLLPKLNREKKLPEAVVTSQVKFAKICREAWIRLLFESEPRANFVDGDVLEEALGEPERGRKAGHLTADLLERGTIQATDVIDLLDISPDEELLKSLTEGVIVARDRNLIDKEAWEKIINLSKEKPTISAVLESALSPVNETQTLAVEDKVENIEQWLDTIANQLRTALVAVEEKYKLGSELVLKISPERTKWLRSVEKDQAIDSTAERISLKLQNNEIKIEDIERFCHKKGLAEAYPIAGARSIFKAVEKLAAKDLKSSQKQVEKYQPLIQKLWNIHPTSVNRTNSLLIPSPSEESRSLPRHLGGVLSPFCKCELYSEFIEVRDEIISGLSHVRKLDIIGDELLNKFGTQPPDLSLPFSVDLGQLVSTDFKYLLEAVQKIKDQPILSEYVYPLFLVFGSRIKGQSSLKADHDVGIFIKPNTPWEKRKEILERLHQEIPELKKIDKILEYWLEEKNGGLEFRQAPKGVTTIAGAGQIHFLLGGVWLGDKEELKKLSGEIMEKYFDLSRFEDQKDQVRSHLLRQIEMDVLQYRLMHKGYRRFYPNKRGMGTEHCRLIDWESDFWDPGYRRVATLLFLSRVFLPDLY